MQVFPRPQHHPVDIAVVVGADCHPSPIRLLPEGTSFVGQGGRRIDAVTRLSSGEDTLADQVRARVVLVVLHFGSFQTADLSSDEPARRAAARDVALDLAGRCTQHPSRTTASALVDRRR